MGMYLEEWMQLQGLSRLSSTAITFLFRWLDSRQLGLTILLQEWMRPQDTLSQLFTLAVLAQWTRALFTENTLQLLRMHSVRTFTQLATQSSLTTLPNLVTQWLHMKWSWNSMHFLPSGPSKQRAQTLLETITGHNQWAQVKEFFSFGKRQPLLRTARDSS